VLDDVVYNGRVSQDSVLSAILKINPLKAQTVDRLSTPFLVFVADFDAAGGSDADLDRCLLRLWETMKAELTAIFQHCLGFAEVTDAAGFCAYIRKCRVETTMPFNDYWSATPKLKVFDTRPYIYAGIAAAALFVIGLFIWRPWLPVLGLLGLGGAVVVAYRKIMAAGARPFPVSVPPGPGADLPTVLKALEVQRGFTAFAIETQGKDAHALYDAFGAFIAATRPDDLASATQPPGVIGV